jgi:hypothetical protein
MIVRILITIIQNTRTSSPSKELEDADLIATTPKMRLSISPVTNLNAIRSLYALRSNVQVYEESR